MSTNQSPLLSVAPAAIKRDLSWLAHHLILVGIIIGVLFLGVYQIENLMERHDKAREAASAQALQLVVEQVKSLEAHQAQNDAAVAQREAARDVLINSLVATIAKRDAALEQQIKKNATLTAQQAADRLTQQYKAAPGQIVASGDTIIADLPISRQFVNTYDQLIGCTGDLDDTKKLLTAEQARTADLKTQVADRDGVVKGKNDELVKQKGNYEDQIKTLKDGARKSKLKWFAAGFVLGTGVKTVVKYIAGF